MYIYMQFKVNTKNNIIVALITNLILVLIKGIGFIYSGSSSLLASLIDSLSGVVSQLLLIFGGKMAHRPATKEHPFGFGKESYFWSLISASVTLLGGSIFMIGYGIFGIISGEPYQPIGISLIVIFISLLLKSFSLLVSLERFNGERRRFRRGFIEHIRKSSEISTKSIMMHDVISIVGLFLAFIGVLLSMLTQTAIFDQLSSIVIGITLGFLGTFVVGQNHKYLLDRSDLYLTSMARNTWKHLDYVDEIKSIVSITQNSETSIVIAKIKLKRSVYEFGSETNSLTSISDAMSKEVSAKIPRAKYIFIEFS